MELKSSSHISSQPTVCPYPEPAKPSPREHTSGFPDSYSKSA